MSSVQVLIEILSSLTSIIVITTSVYKLIDGSIKHNIKDAVNKQTHELARKIDEKNEQINNRLNQIELEIKKLRDLEIEELKQKVFDIQQRLNDVQKSEIEDLRKKLDEMEKKFKDNHE